MKKSFLYGLLVSALLSSCMKHQNLYNGEDDSDKKKKEEYDKNFPVKDIDPKQDWNMAKQIMVDVSVNYGGDDEYTIKVYSDNPRDPEVQAYLLGKYTVKDGSRNSLFADAVSSVESVYVCCIDVAHGSVMKTGRVENGKTSVAFGVTMSGKAVSGRAEEKMEEFDGPTIYNLVKPGTGIFREGNTPIGGKDIMTSYEFVYKGEFKIYPVYGETAGTDDIGYYYYDPKEGIGTRTEHRLLQIIDDSTSGSDFLQYQPNEAPATYWLPWFFHNYATGSNEWEKGNTPVMQGASRIKSKAYTISIKNPPTGCRVGFYIKNGNAETLYSNMALNPKTKGGKAYSAVIYNGNSIPQYIGLEDAVNGDFDCNDIIFCIPGQANIPDVTDPDVNKPEETPMTWTVACEDLGSTGDYDFNDIVFGVTHVSGETTATFTPYAAGGTLAATIGYGTVEIGEIHALLGSSSTTTMINTNSKGKVGESKVVNVNSDFAMSLGMGDVYLKIDGDNVRIDAPGRGEVPQMICVPGAWAWPTERTNIVSAYPDFGEWGANYNTHADWWKKPQGSVVK